MLKILLKTLTSGSVMLAATPQAAKQVISKMSGTRISRYTNGCF